MSFPIIFNGLDKGHHLEVGEKGLIAIRDQKGCCFSKALTQQIGRERLAVQSATKIITNNLRDFDGPQIEIMYAAVNRRYKSIRAQTSGIIGWIKSLFRTCAHNRELKGLKNDYYALQQAFPKKFLIDCIAHRHIGKPALEADREICKQIKQELPDFFKKGKIKSEDFKNAPFFIRQVKKGGYIVIFPSKNGSTTVSKPLDSLCNLKKLIVEQYASDLLKFVKEHMDPLASLLPPSNAMKFSTVVNSASFTLNIDYSSADHGRKTYSLEIRPPVAKEIVLQKAKRCFMQAALVPQRTSLPTFLQFYQAHGADIKDLNLENIRGLNIENLRHICERCPNLESLTVSTDSVRQLDFTQLKNLKQLTLYCKNLEGLNCSGLDKLTQLCISPIEQLKTLNLNGCSNLDLPSFHSYKALIELDLTKCKYETLSFYQLPELQKLTLDHGQTIKELQFIACPKLETLFANHCPVLDSVFLKDLPKLEHVNFLNSENLREVSLDGLTKFGDQFKEGGFYHFNLAQLNIFSIEQLKIKNMPIHSITPAKSENLKHLNFSDMPTLQMIGLNNLSIESIELKNLLGLKSLEFSHNRFTEESFDSLCQQIPRLENFKWFNLEGATVTKAMKEKLEAVLKQDQYVRY